MKKSVCVILSAILLFCMLTPAFAAGLTKEELTGEKWKLMKGNAIEFKKDGTCRFTFVNGSDPSTAKWSFDGNKIEYAFDSWPNMKYALTCTEKDGQTVLVNQQGSVYYKASYVDQVIAQYENVPYEPEKISLGGKISIEGADLSLDSYRTGSEIRSSGRIGYMFKAKNDKEIIVCLHGKLENTGVDTLQLEGIKAEIVIDGQSYIPWIYVEYDGSFKNSLDPLCDGELAIGASVPKKIVDKLSTLTLRLGMNDGFTDYPALYQMAQHTYELTATKKQLKKAEYVVKRTRTYFKDAPKLPEPSSFVDVYQSGSSKSTVNGKVSKNVVQFKASSGEDITALLKTYIRKIKKEGFKVQHSGDTYTISSGKKKLATVKISKGTMEFDLK